MDAVSGQRRGSRRAPRSTVRNKLASARGRRHSGDRVAGDYDSCVQALSSQLNFSSEKASTPPAVLQAHPGTGVVVCLQLTGPSSPTAPAARLPLLRAEVTVAACARPPAALRRAIRPGGLLRRSAEGWTIRRPPPSSTASGGARAVERLLLAFARKTARGLGGTAWQVSQPAAAEMPKVSDRRYFVCVSVWLSSIMRPQPARSAGITPGHP